MAEIDYKELWEGLKADLLKIENENREFNASDGGTDSMSWSATVLASMVMKEERKEWMRF